MTKKNRKDYILPHCPSIVECDPFFVRESKCTYIYIYIYIYVYTYTCIKQRQMSNVNLRARGMHKRRQTNERTPLYILLRYQSEETKYEETEEKIRSRNKRWLASGKEQSSLSLKRERVFRVCTNIT